MLPFISKTRGTKVQKGAESEKHKAQSRKQKRLKTKDQRLKLKNGKTRHQLSE
jgi:hypothetical protein